MPAIPRPLKQAILCQSTHGHDGWSLSPPWVSLQGCLLKTPVLTGITCTGDALHMTGPRFHSLPCRHFPYPQPPQRRWHSAWKQHIKTRKKIFSPEKNWKGWTRFICVCCDRQPVTHSSEEQDKRRAESSGNVIQALFFQCFPPHLLYFSLPPPNISFYSMYIYAIFLLKLLAKNHVVCEQVLQEKCWFMLKIRCPETINSHHCTRSLTSRSVLHRQPGHPRLPKLRLM